MSDWKNVQYKGGKMRTSEGGGGGGGHTYSTTEQVVGTWIDGNSIYEITIELNSQLVVSNTSWTDSGIDASDKAMIIDVRGMDEVDHSFYSFNGLIESNKIKLQACRTSNAYLRILVIQYTKTTN